MAARRPKTASTSAKTVEMPAVALNDEDGRKGARARAKSDGASARLAAAKLEREADVERRDEMDALQAAMKAADELLAAREAAVENAERELAERERVLRTAERDLNARETAMEKDGESLELLNVAERAQSEELQEREATLRLAQHEVETRARQLEVVAASLNARERELESTSASLLEREMQVGGAERALESRADLLLGLERDVAGREHQIAEREAGVAMREERIALREERVSGREASAQAGSDLAPQREALAARERELQARMREVAARDDALQARARELAARDEELSIRETAADEAMTLASEAMDAPRPKSSAQIMTEAGEFLEGPDVEVAPISAAEAQLEAMKAAEEQRKQEEQKRAADEHRRLLEEGEQLLLIARQVPALATLEPRVKKALAGAVNFTVLTAFYNMAVRILAEQLKSGAASSEETAELEEKLSVAKKELEDANGLIASLKEDFTRYRSRQKSEQETFQARANEKLLREIIPVTDNFDLALAASGAANIEAVLAGVKMIQRQFMDVLAREGLVPIKADAGQPFDPKVHEAVAQVETTEVPEDTVFEEVRRGYTLGGKVFRPASVKVATRPGST